jgi:hypothetical protein
MNWNNSPVIKREIAARIGPVKKSAPAVRKHRDPGPNEPQGGPL